MMHHRVMLIFVRTCQKRASSVNRSFNFLYLILTGPFVDCFSPIILLIMSQRKIKSFHGSDGDKIHLIQKQFACQMSRDDI